MPYIEFRVRVEDTRSILAWQAPAPPVKGDVHYETLSRQTVHVLNRWLAEGRIKDRDELTLLGSHLYGILFQGLIGKQFRESYFGKPKDTVLRVVLEFLPAARDLATLPWEYLYFPDSNEDGRGFFIAARSNLILSRHVPLSGPADVGRHKSKELRVLLVLSQPEFELVEETRDDEPVTVQRTMGIVESVDVVALLKDLEKTSQGRIRIGTLEQPSRRSFTEELQRFDPHVVHFVGHGRYTKGSGALAFVSKTRAGRAEATWLADAAFADCFLEMRPQLIFLHACEGARSDSYEAFSGVALQLVYSRLPAVIAMQYPISNEVAVAFARCLYHALSQGRAIDEAVQEGRRELGLYLDEPNFSSRAFGSPVVFLQSKDASSLEGLVIEPEQPAAAAGAVSAALAAGRTLRCPQIGCAALINPDRQYCQKCRQRYKLCTNPVCGLAVEFGAKFCDNCNTDLMAVGVPAEAAAAPVTVGRF